MSSNEKDFYGFEDWPIPDQTPLPGKFGIIDQSQRYGTRRKLEDSEESGTAKKATKFDTTNTNTNMGQRKHTNTDMTDDTLNTDDDDQHETQDAEIKGKEAKKKKGESKTNKNTTRSNWIKNTTHTIFFIERNDEKQKPIHVMEIAKILHNIGIKNYKDLKFAGQGRYRISFNKARDAEDLINSKLLTDEFHYKVYVPNMLKQTIGVIRNVPPSLTDQEIAENIHAGKIKIDKVERIKRMVDGDLTPTYSIKIYVNGQELPQFVAIYGVDAKVEEYIFPIKLCNVCWRYGHKKKACKSKDVRCENCGQDHDSRICTNQTQCIQCRQPHKVTDKNCPERIRQDKIRYAMANEKLTFAEAANKFPRPNQTQTRLAPLNSLTAFPPMLTSGNNNESNHRNRPNTQTPLNTRSQTQTIQNIVQQVKEQLIEQLNLAGIMNKISAIQKTIIKHADKTKNNKDSIDSDILLIKISDQINSIIKPEVTTESLCPPGPSWKSIET